MLINSAKVTTPKLSCPVCGDSLSPVMEWEGYNGQYFDGTECDNYSCMAEWDKFGDVRKESQIEGSAL
jgi:C4-type Zn-finger protein